MQYEILKIIPEHSLGPVFEAYSYEKDRKVLVRRCLIINEKISKEYLILHLLGVHKNIFKLEDYFISRNEAKEKIENFIYEYSFENLYDVVENSKKNKEIIPLKLMKCILLQIFEGVSYIHSKNIIHRNISLKNIVFGSDGLTKISNFRQSKIINKKIENSPFVGTGWFRAPELIIGLTNYDEKIDVYSCGIILLKMATSGNIFNEKNDFISLINLIKYMDIENEFYFNEFQIPEEGLNKIKEAINDKKIKLEEIIHKEYGKENIEIIINLANWY